MRNSKEFSYYGNKYWCLNDLLHREDGPAVEYANGDKVWYINGQCHREDGPAIEWAYGGKEWHINGEKFDCKTQEEFERYKKLITFL